MITKEDRVNSGREIVANREISIDGLKAFLAIPVWNLQNMGSPWDCSLDTYKSRLQRSQRR